MSTDSTEAEGDTDAGTEATRVVISHPAELSDWGRDQIATSHFRAYLRRILGEVAAGDEFEEFVDVGCCGNTLDIPFRIEAVEGGTRVGDDTDIEYVDRDAEMNGGWGVQSRAGPGCRVDPE